MAGGASDYLENAVLNHIFGGVAYTAPATLYFAAYSSAPNDAGGGTELSGNGYARKGITNNATNFPSTSTSTKSNGAAIEFDAFTGGSQTVVALSVLDSSVAGNMLLWVTLTTAKTFSEGDIIRIPIGGFVVTMD